MGSLRDLNQQHGDSRTLGTHRIGFLPSELPAGGTHGLNLQANDDLDPAKEYMPVMVSWPAAGELFVFEDGTAIYTPAGDGVSTASYRLREDGVLLAEVAPVTFTSGDVGPADVAWSLTGLVLPVEIGTVAWGYTPPEPGAVPYDPAGLVLPVEIGAVVWGYTPPAPEAVPYTPAGLVLPVEIGAVAWAYTPPMPTDRAYARPHAGWRPSPRASYQVAVPPASPVLPLDLLHMHLRLPVAPGQAHPEDALIVSACNSGRRVAQHNSDRAVGEQTIDATLDAFPRGPIVLPLGPATVVLRVAYAAEVNGTVQEQLLPASAYLLEQRGGRSLLHPLDGWPTAARVVGAVTVRYLAGDMPDAVRQAILLLVGHYYRNRQAVTDKQTQVLMHGVDALLGVDQVWGL